MRPRAAEQAPPAAAASPKGCSEVVVAPASGAVLTAQNPDAYKLDFEWRPIAGVEAYGIEVGSQADLRSATSAKPLRQTTYSLGGVKPGHYYWRVSGADGKFVGPGPRACRSASPARARERRSPFPTPSSRR